jgi:UDP-2,4-diacetamido-2,4,6-trideoxy-beta-L-altropyranose hydrolase
MTGAPRILFFADAGPVVGGGHVMRCLTLARALAEAGAECAFVESRAAIQVLRRFGWPGQTLLAVANAEDLGGLVGYASEFAGLFEADVVVVDHYGAGRAEEGVLRGPARRRIVVLDDLADRKHDCELLIDPGYGRRREDYSPFVWAMSKVLSGPDYALVRPEFAAARARAISRRAKHEPAKRGLVSLGLTDLGGITARVTKALTSELEEVRLDVVVGRGVPSLDALAALAETDRRVRLHVDSSEMATLMADADLAVGAGGSSVWERAVVGLPSVSVILADNQAEVSHRLARDGAQLTVDAREPRFEAALLDAWRRLTQDADLRRALALRASELCDGRGAERAAAAILALATG